MKRVLNLGAGTQSSVLLLMADRGEIEPVDVAIFADTGWEEDDVYAHLAWLETQVQRTPIVTVQAGSNIYQDSLVSQVRNDKRKLGRGRWGSMPLFTKHSETGQRGMIRRQCTSEYKIEPIRKYMKTELLGLKKHARFPKHPVVTQIFGMSVDELGRVRTSRDAWIVNEYPFVQMRWHRSKAVEWAERNYPGRVFPRSACVGCPFHSDAEWAKIKQHNPKGWAEVVVLDHALRNATGMRGQVFLHSSLAPIDEVDFSSRDEKSGQLHLFDDECHGMCGA